MRDEAPPQLQVPGATTPGYKWLYSGLVCALSEAQLPAAFVMAARVVRRAQQGG